MKHQTWPLLLLLIAAAPPAPAQGRTPIRSITEAKLSDYRNYYSPSALCAEGELTLWSCDARKRSYALCASPVVTRSSGYMQYRSSDHGKVTFRYPPTSRPPLGLFRYASFANGNASVEFSNGGYRYTLVDPLREASSILVSGPSTSTTEIRCNGNQTLQLNYTMRLMYDAGVWSGD